MTNISPRTGFVRSKYIHFDAVHADYRQVSQQLEAVYCSYSTSISRWGTMAHQNIHGSQSPGRGRIRWRNANSWRASRPQSHKYFKSSRLLLNSSQGTPPWILHKKHLTKSLLHSSHAFRRSLPKLHSDSRISRAHEQQRFPICF